MLDWNVMGGHKNQNVVRTRLGVVVDSSSPTKNCFCSGWYTNALGDFTHHGCRPIQLCGIVLLLDAVQIREVKDIERCHNQHIQRTNIYLISQPKTHIADGFDRCRIDLTFEIESLQVMETF